MALTGGKENTDNDLVTFLNYFLAAVHNLRRIILAVIAILLSAVPLLAAEGVIMNGPEQF